MEIIRLDAAKRRHVHDFERLPFRIYADLPQWVPPFAGETRAAVSRQHAFFRHSAAEFFLAYAGDEVVGRVAVLNNRNYNDYNHASRAHLAMFECIDDPQAAMLLFDAAFDWARAQSLTQAKGPKGFSTLDGIGLLVAGFEHVPALGIPYNPAYYVSLFEQAGLVGVDDVVSGMMTRTSDVPDRIHRLSAAVQKRRGLHIRSYQTRADLRALAPQLGALYNRSLGTNQDNVPLTEAEISALVDRILPIADPSLVKTVAHGDELVGFLLTYPDVSKGVMRSGGRMLPWGWYHLWREKHQTDRLNINGIGILDEYQGLGGTAILFSELYKTVMESRFRSAELVQIRGENDKMQRELRSLGVEFHKVHRLYEIDL